MNEQTPKKKMKETPIEWLQKGLETILTHEQQMQSIGLFEQAKEMNNSINSSHQVIEMINDLEKLLTERIEELHKVQGMQQARHAYIFYRNSLDDIKRKLLNL